MRSIPPRALRQDQRDELAFEDVRLRELGLLDPDQPTRWVHLQERERLTAEFTPTERALIRDALGL
jgi:hypothetical protein